MFKTLRVTVDGNNSTGKCRLQIVYSDFIWAKSLLSRGYKQQLLDWFKFMLMILHLKIKFFSYRFTINWSIKG